MIDVKSNAHPIALISILKNNFFLAGFLNLPPAACRDGRQEERSEKATPARPNFFQILNKAPVSRREFFSLLKKTAEYFILDPISKIGEEHHHRHHAEYGSRYRRDEMEFGDMTSHGTENKFDHAGKQYRQRSELSPLT